MIKVFLLQHSYEVNGVEHSKIIGIYSSREIAEFTIIKYKKLPGFKDYPYEFFIDEYELDEDNWEEGFVSSFVLNDKRITESGG
ncbi:hypothetical protein QE450_003948 [Paenibacillus sp. SORGH_AS306]|uniref:DUF7336 domain-containing protein n=1 Tax=unclassified Paenibacillus TaxID=185978 RepID=UPI00278B30C3|nr:MULTISPECIES: hypothetical protein [unclassified Paenibacillus]MDQ1236450.1 hypothetical protein [Paenibacillus sp. SORGH_AS_0306]MDR6108803.1 hypothetical protein [Paenibacillus sp. SORGH_AS_0338]